MRAPMIWLKVFHCAAMRAYNFMWITWQIWVLFTWSCISPQVKGWLLQTKFTLWTFIIRVLRVQNGLRHPFASPQKNTLDRRSAFNEDLSIVITLTYSLREMLFHVWLMTDFGSIKWNCARWHKNNKNHKHIMHTDAWLAICMINYKQSTGFV